MVAPSSKLHAVSSMQPIMPFGSIIEPVSEKPTTVLVLFEIVNPASAALPPLTPLMVTPMMPN